MDDGDPDWDDATSDGGAIGVGAPAGEPVDGVDLEGHPADTVDDGDPDAACPRSGGARDDIAPDDLGKMMAWVAELEAEQDQARAEMLGATFEVAGAVNDHGCADERHAPDSSGLRQVEASGVDERGAAKCCAVDGTARPRVHQHGGSRIDTASDRPTKI